MPIRDFLASANGDLAIVDGDFAFSGGDTVDANHQAVQQGIQCRLRFMLGECWLDESVGVDWLGGILIKNPDPTSVVAALSAAIEATTDVVAVQVGRFLTNGATRTVSIPYTVQDAYSSNTITGVVSPPLVPQS
jgi:hypothetical protein